jgi:transposase
MAKGDVRYYLNGICVDFTYNGDNNEKISDVLGISSQLSMVLLNIFKSVGSDLKYKHFSDNTVINSVIFIIVVTLIIKYNA